MGVDVGAVDYNLQQQRILTEMEDDRELTPHQLSNLRRRADRKRIEELEDEIDKRIAVIDGQTKEMAALRARIRELEDAIVKAMVDEAEELGLE
jgi:chaperonin cofactor prefoldin